MDTQTKILKAFIEGTDSEYGKDRPLMHFPKNPPDGDGQSVDVYVISMPANCYKIVAREDKNSVGEPVKGFTLSTGSGSEMKVLALAIAKAASEGMIGID